MAPGLAKSVTDLEKFLITSPALVVGGGSVKVQTKGFVNMSIHSLQIHETIITSNDTVKGNGQGSTF